MSDFYGRYARWWPLVSPVDDYASEASHFAAILHSTGPVRTVLELGSGGGHNAAWLKRQFELTLVDLSPEMLAQSMAINPECRHVLGDMRSVRLGETFDAVFVHDSIEYMTTEADLDAAIATVAAHCRPGGVCVIVPDVLRETFVPSTDCGGSDATDGSGVRYLEWTWDPDPSDTTVLTLYSFAFRGADGTLETAHETHETGLFDRSTWQRLLTLHGFEVEVREESTEEEREPRMIFVARRAG